MDGAVEVVTKGSGREKTTPLGGRGGGLRRVLRRGRADKNLSLSLHDHGPTTSDTSVLMSVVAIIWTKISWKVAMGLVGFGTIVISTHAL